MQFQYKTNKKCHYLFLFQDTYFQIMIIFKEILPRPYFMIKPLHSLSSVLLASAICISLSSYGQDAGFNFKDKDPQEWENQTIFNINREAPRAWFVPFQHCDSTES